MRKCHPALGKNLPVRTAGRAEPLSGAGGVDCTTAAVRWGACRRGRARVHVRPEGQSKCAGAAGGGGSRGVPRVVGDSGAARFAPCLRSPPGRASRPRALRPPYQCPTGGKRAVPMPPPSLGREEGFFQQQRDGGSRSPRQVTRRGGRGKIPAPLVPRRRALSTPAAAAGGRARRAEPGREGRGSRTVPMRAGGVRRAVPISGGRAVPRGAGGEGAACARGAVWGRAGSRVSPRRRAGPGRAAASAPSRAPPPPGWARRAPSRPLPLLPVPRPGVWKAPGPFGRTPTRSMPRVRGRGGGQFWGFG